MDPIVQPPPTSTEARTVGKRAVRILLECFLVIDSFNAAHAGSEICKFVQGNLHKLGRTIDQP